MNTKAFSVLLVFVLVLGGGLGGAFAGGVALGKIQSDDGGSSAPLPFSPRQGPSGQAGQQPTDQARQQFGSGQPSQQDLDQLRQRFQSGEINPEHLDGLRQQFSGQGFPGGGGLTGTIEEIEGDTVTVDTPHGALQATINDETVIRKLAVGEPVDLQAGVRVTVIGQPGEDGVVAARSILLNPDDAFGFFGWGFFSGSRQHPVGTSGGEAGSSDPDRQEHSPGSGFFFGGGQQHSRPIPGGSGGSFGQHQP